MKTVTKKVIVAAINSNGESDFHFFKMSGLEKFFETEEYLFHPAAKRFSENEGYEPYLVYDEDDQAGSAILDKFVWESASTVYLDKNGVLIEEGQFVTVPEPDDTDSHSHSFDGTVAGIRNGNVVVKDQEDNSFEIEPYRLEMSEE